MKIITDYLNVLIRCNGNNVLKLYHANTRHISSKLKLVKTYYSMLKLCVRHVYPSGFLFFLNLHLPTL